MDNKFLRILDKGCRGINGAVHVDDIKQFEVEDFNVYAYTSTGRHLVNGFGSRMEAEEFIKIVSEPINVGIEYKVREKCRMHIFRMFIGSFGKHLSIRDICDISKYDFCETYCLETLEELEGNGYLMKLTRRPEEPDDANEYWCPTDPPREAVKAMVSAAFNNSAFNGQCCNSTYIKSALRTGWHRYFPCYPDGWVLQLYGLMFQLGYLRDANEGDNIGPGRSYDDYDVFVESVPEFTYDGEDGETRVYNIDEFVNAIEERNQRR